MTTTWEPYERVVNTTTLGSIHFRLVVNTTTMGSIHYSVDVAEVVRGRADPHFLVILVTILLKAAVYLQ